MGKKVVKADGGVEEFSQAKVFDSMVRAGAESALAERVAEETGGQIGEGASSEDIYQRVYKELDRVDSVTAAKYSLKKAMMRMGPTGFPFEKYVAVLLRENGFETKVGQMVSGRCVMHEVDVWAKKGSVQQMVECKYHNENGARSDLKVALYVFARYLDILEGRRGVGRRGTPSIPLQKGEDVAIEPWLVTNTRVTSAAASYARCAGLNVLAWRYPGERSLEDLIKDKKLYPATIFAAVTNKAWNALQETGILLARDLAGMGAGELGELTGMSARKAAGVIETAGRL